MKKKMTAAVKIIGDEFYLRELDENDATEEYCNWINNPEINKFMWTKETTIDELRQFIKKKRESSDCLFLGIFTKNSDEHIGNIKLEPIDNKNKIARIGILIGNKKFWGRGICSKAVNLLVNYAFKNLGLEKIDLRVITENIPAVRCYQKSGFKIETIEPRAVNYEKYYDLYVMSIEKNR